MPKWIARNLTIAQSGQVSGHVDARDAIFAGLWCPVVDSGTVIRLQASFDSTSANFVRARNPAGSGHWEAAISGGSYFATLVQPIAGAFIRFEASLAQTEVRTLVAIMQSRYGFGR